LLKVYLDGNLVPEPIGLNEISEHLYYSETLISYITEVDGNLTFTGDEYDYIRDVFNNSVCATIEIRILAEDNFDIDFEGLINVADVKFIPDRKFAVCEVQNNNITSRIDNNKSIECNLTAGKTKNDIAYSVVEQTITVPDPTDTNTITRDGIRIFDAFTSIITFLTDGEIGFVSDYFNYNTNTDTQVYSVLMTGKELRTGSGNFPTISFEDLFNDLNGLENIAMAFEDGSIRIENKDYFKKQTSSITFDNVNDLAQSLATETLFAKVSFGSFQTLGQFDYLQDIRFNGMQKEEYHLGGQCNTDTELKLEMRRIITDTNVIQDVIPSAGGMGGNNNDNYDDSVLIIHCDSSNKVQLTEKPASSGTEFYFNDRFVNKNVALRWLGQIPQSIYAYLGAGNDGVFINQTTNFAPSGPTLLGYSGTQETPLPYNDVNGNYQVANRYFPLFSYTPQYIIDSVGTPGAGGSIFNNNMSLGIYTAPANGIYSFEIDVLSPLRQQGFFARMKGNSNSAGWGCIFIDSVAEGSEWRYFGGATFYLDAGDYVGFSIDGGLYNYYAESTFRCFDPLGGAWQTYDASNVYNIQNQITYPIAIEDWKTIKQDPYKSMGITYQSGVTDGWLKDIKRNVRTGTSEVTLLGKKNG